MNYKDSFRRLHGSVSKSFCLLLLVCCCLSLQAQQFDQLKEKISLKVSRTNVLRLIEETDKQSRYAFLFAPELLEKIVIENYEVKEMPLGQLLKQWQDKFQLQFSVADANIFVKPRQKSAVETQAAPAPLQQKGITGRIVDFENGDPLTGASVQLEGTNYGASSDDKGNFRFHNIPSGLYTIEVSYVGYKKTRISNIRVAEGKNTVVDVKLQVDPEAKNILKGVTVKARRERRIANTTDAQLVNEIYSAKSVVSGISNEQIARTLDRDAAEVVKRVPGINITPDNFVVVRGLNKRYNITFLNDAMAPATDADSRSFSYDVISSNAIDRIMVYKSPSPDLPGEFAGGLVKIHTKRSQLSRQFDIQISTQYRPGSSFENIWSYAGGKYDFLGFDDGTRKLPGGIPSSIAFNRLGTAENARFSKQFRNIYALDKQYYAGPDLRFNMNYYDVWKVGGKTLKNLTALAYTNTHEQRETEQSSYPKHLDGRITQGIHQARLSVIQHNEMRINNNFTLELRNMFSANNQRVAVEDYLLPDDFPDIEARHTNLYYSQNLLYSGQVAGSLLLGKEKQHTLKANLSYNSIHKSEPDNRDYTLYRGITAADKELPDDKNPWHMRNEIVSFYLLSRVFNDIREHTMQGNIDFDYRINNIWGFKTGVYHETRVRDFSNRTFVLLNGVNLYDPNLAIAGSKYQFDNGNTPTGSLQIKEKYLQQYFTPEMFREDGTGYRWVEKTTPNNQYYADNSIYSGYLSTDFNLLNDRLNIFGGARIEHNRFRILGSYEAGLASYPMEVNQPITSVLPSINISFKPDSSLVIRAGYGKTVNRPEFREAAPIQYTNYLDKETYIGNPLLTTVNVDNTELRLEWYPNSSKKNEMMNLGFFYKELDRPIERFRMVFSEGFDQFAYANTGKAKVYGLEAEIRKDFDFIPGSFFRRFSTIINGSWFHSNVKVPPQPNLVGYANPRSRRLQGQSPYLVNASLNYEDAGNGTKISLSYNRAGDYLYAVGTNEGERLDTDIMMQARDQLDLTWRQRINKMFSINAGVQNLLNAPMTMYQDFKRNYRFDPLAVKPQPQNPSKPDGDIIFRKYYPRPYYSLAVNMIF